MGGGRQRLGGGPARDGGSLDELQAGDRLCGNGQLLVSERLIEEQIGS